MLWMGNSIQNTLLHRHWSISSLKNKPKYCLYSTHTHSHTHTLLMVATSSSVVVVIATVLHAKPMATDTATTTRHINIIMWKWVSLFLSLDVFAFTECVCVVVCMRVERSTICWRFPNKPNASVNALCQTRDMFTLFRFRFDGTATGRKTIAKFYKNNNNVYMWKWSLENRRHRNVRCGVLGPHPITSPAYGKEFRWWDAI